MGKKWRPQEGLAICLGQHLLISTTKMLRKGP